MAGNLASEKFKKQGQTASNMSALEMAAMGKYMQQEAKRTKAAKEAAEKGTPVEETAAEPALLEMDYKDKDWETLVVEAKSKGPRSWFASKVDFTLNGAHFLGKVGFPVTAGVVPLFDGAAIDLQSSKMQSWKLKDAKPDPVMGEPSAFDYWITGVGGMLVLAPVGMDNVIPVTMQNVTITEKGITGEAQKAIRFYHGTTSVEATGLTLGMNGAELKDTKIIEQNGEETMTTPCDAEVTGEGIVLTKKETKVEPATPPEPDYEADTQPEKPQPVNDVENIVDRRTTSQKLQETALNKLTEKLSEEQQIGEHVTFNAAEGTAQLSVESEEQTKGAEIVDNQKSELIGTVVEAVKNQASETAKETFDTARKQGTRVAVNQLMEKAQNAKNVMTEATDQLTLENLQDAAKFAGETMKKNMSDEEAKEAWAEKLGDKKEVLDKIKDLLGIEEKEEDEESEETETEGDFTLLDIPIVPGISFHVSLQPRFSYQFFANLSGENLDNLYNSFLNMEPDKRESGTADLHFMAGVRASLGLGAMASMEEGIPFLIKGFQGLYADASMNGNQGENNEAFTLGVDLGVKRNANGSFGLGDKDIKASIKGGFDLVGTVGAKIGLKSELFMWKKTLYQKKFAEWKLASISLNLGMTKDRRAKGLTGGWSLDQASVSVAGRNEGIGKAFTDSNPAEQNYGLTTPDVEASTQYGDLQNDFDAALKLLKEFVNPPQGKLLLIPKENDQEENGLVGTMANMEEVMRSFTHIWAAGQLELENEQQKLENYKNSKIYKRKRANAEDRMKRHEDRLKGLEEWKTTNGKPGGAQEQVALEKHYGSLAGRPGIGFRRSLREKVAERTLTFERVTDYEKKRYQELTEQASSRIKFLEEEISKQQAGGKGAMSNAKIVSEYGKKSGAKALKHKAQYLGSARGIIDYEMDLQQNAQAEAIAHKSKARTLSTGTDVKKARADAEKDARKKQLDEEAVKKAGDVAGLKKFFELYAKELSGEMALQYGSVEGLLAYERGRQQFYVDKSRKKKKSKWNADYEAYERTSKGTAYDPEMDETAKTKYKESIKKELYRTATLEDLIEFDREYNTGDKGTMLLTFLANQETLAEDQKADLKDPKILESIYSDKKVRNDAMKIYRERLAKRVSEEDLRFMTVELLLDYAKKRKAKAKKPEDVKEINDEIFFLNRAQIIVESADPAKAVEEEADLVKQYFDRYSKTAESYQKDLGSGAVVNMALMKDVMQNGESEQLQKLVEYSEAGNRPKDYEILKEYLSLKNDKGAVDALNAFLERKMGKSDYTAEQLNRFHESKLAEETNGIGNHVHRINKLEYFVRQGYSYSQLLEEYKKLGATTGYADYIKDNVRKGILYDKDVSRDMTVEDVLKFEQNRILDAGAAQQALINFVLENEKTMSYPELLEEYEKRSKESTLGVIQKKIDKRWNMTSGYEDKFAKDTLTPEQILDFERKEFGKIGVVHKLRLMNLYGVESLPDDLSELVPPVEEAVKEERVREYEKTAKRVNKDTIVKLAREVELQNIYADDNKLYAEMKSYEEERKASYEKEFNELNGVKDKIQKRIDTLGEQVGISSSVVQNIKDIKEHPEIIYKRIDQFERAIKMDKEREQVEASIAAEKQKLVDEIATKEAAINVLTYTDEDAGEEEGVM